MKKIIFAVFVFSLSFQMKAQLRLPGILSSGMVLQQKDSVTLWGWALPSEKIAVTTSWNSATDTVIATNEAKWKLKIKTPVAGGPYTIRFQGYTTIELTDVMIGEVWVCSGQSNMEWNYYSGVDDLQPELDKGLQKNIRLFHIPKSVSNFPQEDVAAKWQVCDSTALKSFSAAGYFFGKKLQENIDVPIGLINASWGGTPAEVWTPEEIIASNPILKEAAAQQKEVPWCPVKPGVVYNAMLNPITFFPVAGAIWYQGESNVGTADSYGALFTTMIDTWRSKWKKDFPFYFVQIAPFTYGDGLGGALLREQQILSSMHPKTGMVVVSDLVHDVTDIHPRNKKDVGYRLADFALNEVYGKSSGLYQSPLFRNYSIEKDRVIIDFFQADNGLKINGKKVTELFIADENKVFHPAEAKLVNNRLQVWNKKIKKPTAVRYMFSNAGVGNLFSVEGLPVAPFRTDNWPVE